MTEPHTAKQTLRAFRHWREHHRFTSPVIAFHAGFVGLGLAAADHPGPRVSVMDRHLAGDVALLDTMLADVSRQ